MTTDTRYTVCREDIDYLEGREPHRWTNYATWFLYMEVFDRRNQYLPWGWIAKYERKTGDITPESAEALVDQVLEHVIGCVAPDHMSTNHIAATLANAFISEVNWHEIAAYVHEQSDEVQTALNIKNAKAMDAWLDAPEETKEPES